MNLPRQARARVGRRGIVVVVVEIVGRGDLAKCWIHWLDYPVVGYRVPPAVQRLLIIEGEVVSAGVTVLGVIEYVEKLNAELGGNTLGDSGYLRERNVDLPGV